MRWHIQKQKRDQIVWELRPGQWRQLARFYAPDNRCPRCRLEFCEQITARQLTMDHIVPVSLGGRTIAENVQPLCRACNAWKSDRHILDYRHDGGVFATRL